MRKSDTVTKRILNTTRNKYGMLENRVAFQI